MTATQSQQAKAFIEAFIRLCMQHGMIGNCWFAPAARPKALGQACCAPNDKQLKYVLETGVRLSLQTLRNQEAMTEAYRLNDTADDGRTSDPLALLNLRQATALPGFDGP